MMPCESCDRLAKEVERLREKEWGWLIGSESPDHLDKCPTYYDGCHCSVETLIHNIDRAKAAEARVVVLEAALEGVIRVADRKTDEFDAARAALAATGGDKR